MKNEQEKKGTAIKEVVKDAILSDVSIKEFIFREGAAEVIIPKVKRIDVDLSGTISAPAEFFKKRPKQFDYTRAHVIFSKNPDKLFITLKTNEHRDNAGYEITGTLELSDEMKLFGIAYKSSQQPKSYTVKELGQLLRFNKKLFAHVDECTKVINGLEKFKIQVDAQVTQEKEKGGSSQESYSIKVSHDIPLKFTLKMPLYKSKPDKTFEVEINFLVRAAKDITLWLESPALATFIQDDANTFINEELEVLSELVQIEN